MDYKPMKTRHEMRQTKTNWRTIANRIGLAFIILLLWVVALLAAYVAGLGGL
jgi:hypothetical protein